MREFVFTFGFGQQHEGGYHVIEAEDEEGARQEMFRRFGRKWAFCYGSREEAGVERFGLHEVKWEPEMPGGRRDAVGKGGAMKKAYYDYRATLMDTDSTFCERGKVRAQDGQPMPLEDMQVDDPETGKRWQLEGLWQGPALDRDDLLALLEWWGQNDDHAIVAEVTDNGACGDGLWLEIRPNARHGQVETHPARWGNRESDKVPALLLAVRLTARQAAVLGAALTAAATLRLAQGGEP